MVRGRVETEAKFRPGARGQEEQEQSGVPAFSLLYKQPADDEQCFFMRREPM